MNALLRYHWALLLRSYRWLPPLILYAVFLAIGVQYGQPVLDGLGYTAAAVLPVTAWLVRAVVTMEPVGARHCVAAARGGQRAHLAGLLVAGQAGVVLGLAGVLATVAVSDPHSTVGQVPVRPLTALPAGVLATLVCVLLGLAVGALCNRPVLRGPGWPVPATMLAALLVLVPSGSPANAAVTGLVTGSRDGTVDLPWLPLLIALGAAGAVTAGVAALVTRRG
ncbi:ABC transporter [Streptomyces sp. NPDC005438]|uniref:ABC transporter n=1 Tax=Streptomyces sp. NPDC005438 TaxID=3156880 RepID=UPI0033B1B9D8